MVWKKLTNAMEFVKGLEERIGEEPRRKDPVEKK